MPAITIRLSPELYEAIKDRAEEEDRAVASLLRQAARHYLNDYRYTNKADPASDAGPATTKGSDS